MSFIETIIEVINFYRKNFPEIYSEAFTLLKNRSVKKYLLVDTGLIIRTVVGEEGEYMVYINPQNIFGSVCSCKDYTYNIMFRSKKEKGIYRFLCQHLLASLISILAEYAYCINTNKLEFFKKRDLLPEVFIEEKYIIPMLLELL